MRKLVLVLVAFIAAALLLILYRPSRKEVVHYHAGFIVYVDGVKQDFSDFKYMDIKPCTTNGKETSADTQIKKAHLHDGVGDVVHVEADGATWEDLFKNINFQFPDSRSVTGYNNGQQLPNFLKQPILPDESVIIVAGKTSGIDLQNYVPLDHIKEVGSRSESCGTSN